MSLNILLTLTVLLTLILLTSCIEVDPLKWHNATKPGEEPPKGAIEAGFGIYVARAWFDKSELVPGKYVMGYTEAFISYGNVEHQRSDFEILCDETPEGKSKSYAWQRFNGSIPEKAVEGGESPDGRVFIGRTRIQGDMVAGKVWVPHKTPTSVTAYFPYAGKEQMKDNFDVLVRK